MNPLLRRIALQGGMTALLLGVVGLLLSELASMWLATAPGGSTDIAAGSDGDGTASVNETLRSRIPLMMAAWGFAFVAVGELLISLWRRKKQPQPMPTTVPNLTEQKLAELLRQSDPSLPPANESISEEIQAK
jgi:hypothetical protein